MKHSIFWITFFAISMAFVESSVVVYLRELYYPDGFNFPLQIIEGHVAVTEILREVATIIMLLGVAVLASKKRAEVMAWFIYAFAIWDIFYYVFLKFILNWPASFLTWDILFLIPVTWTGPVLAPLINSATMVILALVIIFYSRKGCNVSLKWHEWVMIIAGCLITITAYTLDYTSFLLDEFSFGELFSISRQEEFIVYASQYIPAHFNWYLFSAGELLFVLTIWLFRRRLFRCTP